ncbi:MAG: YeeE/YedE thiosulfate transporter family protein [Alphaproteobacteria bacterium]
MAEFSWIAGLAGGAMIGAAAALLLLIDGRIAGISGILGGLLDRRAGEVAWRAAFVAGLIAGPLLVLLLGGAVTVRPQASLAVLIVAGLLVGFGTRLGGGCTSGHGVCGLARLSPRSMAATATFFAAALLTVVAVRHMIGG